MTDARQQELGWDRLALPAGGAAQARWPSSWLLWRVAAVAVALLLHVLLFAGGLKVRPDEIGLIDGDKDAMAVEILDASAFDAQTGAKAAVEPHPNSKPETSTPPIPPSQPEPPAAAASSTPQPIPIPPSDDAILTLPGTMAAAKPGLDLSVPQATLTTPPQKKQLTASEQVNKQLASASPRARAGEIDDYTRGVMRLLESSKPKWNGSTGQLVAEFTISPSGEIQNLHVVQSSGRAELDKLVLASLGGLHFLPPPAGASYQDRTFDITYY